MINNSFWSILLQFKNVMENMYEKKKGRERGRQGERERERDFTNVLHSFLNIEISILAFLI